MCESIISPAWESKLLLNIALFSAPSPLHTRNNETSVNQTEKENIHETNPHVFYLGRHHGPVDLACSRPMQRCHANRQLPVYLQRTERSRPFGDWEEHLW